MGFVPIATMMLDSTAFAEKQEYFYKGKLSLLAFIASMIFVSCYPTKPISRKKHDLDTEVGNILAYPPFKTASFGFYAIDLNSGEEISAYQPDIALKPASTQKLITTAAALEILGPDFTFETKLAYTGDLSQENGYLNGNLLLIGGGDPSLGSKYFEQTAGKQFLNEFVNKIKDYGIDSVSGRIIADARYFDWDIIPPTWSWQNIGQYYGASANGLAIYDNYFSILFNTFDYGNTTLITGIRPFIEGLKLTNYVVADSISYDNAYVFGAPYSNRRTLTGELPVRRTNYVVEAATPDPAYLAALQLDSALKANNISVNQKATTIRRIVESGAKNNLAGFRVFYTKRSVSLKEIIEQTNIHSINLFAEHCLLQLAGNLGGKKQTVPATDSLMSFWAQKGMDTQGMSLNDGSGLSHYNAVTPRQMVFVLDYMKNSSAHFKEFYSSLAVGGRSGTLENMFKGSSAEGNIRAKSGTVTRGKAYAGYLTSASGREIAFSMIVNNFSGSSDEAKAKLEELMTALSDFNK